MTPNGRHRRNFFLGGGVMIFGLMCAVKQGSQTGTILHQADTKMKNNIVNSFDAVQFQRFLRVIYQFHYIEKTTGPIFSSETAT